MATGELSQYAINLAIEIVSFYKWLTTEKKEFVMSKQMLRSGTSIGANVHEANYAASRADFINKMQIALKEAAETEYWLIVMERTGYTNSESETIKKHLMSVKRMLVATLNTAKSE